MSSSAPVMLVEDSPMDVELALQAFARCGIVNPVHLARDGEEALGWIPRWESGERRPALVLLDINLPRVSGLDVVRALKGRPQLRAIPVVMLTTSARPSDVEAAYQAGANSYVLKSHDFGEFTSLLGTVVGYWTRLNRLPD